MKEKMKSVFLSLLVTLISVVFFYHAVGHYTLVLFDTISIPEWIFDILAYGMGALMGLGAIFLWRETFRKK